MSGGLHVYFKYNSSDPDTAYLIKTFFKQLLLNIEAKVLAASS